MRNSFIANLILLLSVCVAVAIASPESSPAAVLQVRQSTTAPTCADYSRIANLTTIGFNTTYRSAFFLRSSTGSMYDMKMFNDAKAALPALTKNAALNQQCGNLTATAITEAEKNFTQGIVAQFTDVTPGTIKSGPEVVIIVGCICLLFSGVWSFMP